MIVMVVHEEIIGDYLEDRYMLECCDELSPYERYFHEVVMNDGTKYIPLFYDYDDAIAYAHNLGMTVIE